MNSTLRNIELSIGWFIGVLIHIWSSFILLMSITSLYFGCLSLNQTISFYLNHQNKVSARNSHFLSFILFFESLFQSSLVVCYGPMPSTGLLNWDVCQFVPVQCKFRSDWFEHKSRPNTRTTNHCDNLMHSDDCQWDHYLDPNQVLKISHCCGTTSSLLHRLR